MNFAQLEYPLFLFFVFLCTFRLASATARKSILLVASYYFYCYWDYRFAALLVFSTVLDFVLALGIAVATRPWQRRWCLAMSLVGNLGVLGFFKYFHFFVDSAQAILGRWELHAETVSIILPIGISFYTFQTLSYSIDVYRGTIRPCRSLLDFGLYVAFFPQLVAGPIVRASEFLPQLQRFRAADRTAIYRGSTQILRGFVKKLLIADQLATVVDPVFATPGLFAWPTVALGVIAYAGQIYGDFSGYTDIAIGSARVLGISLPDNFRHPYLATSPADFWRRWHITLSTWLRDYLYIPLGGSRGGTFRTYRNLMITMTLGGLWHGAAWTFVLWGIWHGCWLCATRPRRSRRDSELGGQPSWPFSSLSMTRAMVGWLLTQSIVLSGWTLFRAPSMSGLRELWSQLLWPAHGLMWLPPSVVIALSLLVAEHLIWLSSYREILSLRSDRWYTPWLVGFAVAALVLWSPREAAPFVYFQF